MNTWDDLPSTYSLQEVADVLQSRSEQHASSVLSAMQRDGVKKEVVFAKDLTLRNKVPACGYPFWYFPAGEKLMFQIENNTSIEGGQEAASRTTGSDMTTGNAAKSSVTSFATYRLRYKLHLPIDTLTLRDDMLYYVTWKTGKLRLVNGKADLNTTHMVRNGNNEPVLENQRFFYAFTKKFAEGKAVQRTKERTVRTPEEQVRDLKAFPFASPLKVGMTDPKCVFVSDLRSPSPEFQHPHCDGYIGLLNGLYFSPQHIGYGDHGNTSHVSDAIIQTCHAYLRYDGPEVRVCVGPTLPFTGVPTPPL
eukprot:TRINITY_DN7435_c0_g3_i1.p1 TRINITY_DN7435_c0_g3~~TRINITY_DN7435_c0_g3_i1.p1  ORF type:complete len:315 (+),score=71.56 TRINITY_DN7435_c0_g3_i1:30-947(+)